MLDFPCSIRYNGVCLEHPNIGIPRLETDDCSNRVIEAKFPPYATLAPTLRICVLSESTSATNVFRP